MLNPNIYLRWFFLIIVVFCFNTAYSAMDVKTLSKWLDSPDLITRKTALKTIEKQKSIELLPKVTTLLKKDPNENIRTEFAL